MYILTLGLAIFMSIHLMPLFAVTRDTLKDKIGVMPYRALHSFLALLGLALIIHGYALARTEDLYPLYVPEDWMRHVTMLLMVPVFILVFAAYFHGKIAQKTKHPMVLGIKIWAFAHLLSNGEPQSVLLFVTFLVWAILLRISYKKRGIIPAGVAPNPNASRNDVLAILLGLLVYGLFVWKLHGWLIGVPLIT